MEAEGQGARPQEDEVTYFVNRDSQGWVAQTVRRRVYIELKIECTLYRSRDVQKARDDWLCVYCRNGFPSKLRLSDHRVGGCPCGPVDASGRKLELPVYPNLKTAKQGKDLKAALQRGERSCTNVLRDDSMWLELNPELRDVAEPPLGARVHVRRFMLQSIEHLAASHVTWRGGTQSTTRSQRSPLRQPAHSAASDFVDLGDDGTDEAEQSTSRPKKRSRSQMEDCTRNFHSTRQFKEAPRRPNPEPAARRQNSEPAPRRQNPEPTPRAARPKPTPPPHPIRVKPIASRSPSPERMAILAPPISAPPSPVAQAAPTPPVTPVPPTKSPRADPLPADADIVTGLRKERQAFYVGAATSARASVKMDTPKPALRPPIQPPGLYYLMQCGLLKFDAKCSEFPAFQEELEAWKNDPAFKHRLLAAYGTFHLPKHQVIVHP